MLTQTLGRPSIDTVAPRLVSEGEEVLLIGSNFAYAASVEDLGNVTIDGVQCNNVRMRSPTAIICEAPTPTSDRLERSRQDASELADLDVVVTQRYGISSPPANISYEASGAPLQEIPSRVIAWRPIGVGGTVEVRWVYPVDDVLDSIAAVQSFDIEMKTISAGSESVVSGSDASDSASSQVSGNTTVIRRAVDDIQSVTEVKGGMIVYSEHVVAISRYPMRLRVRAVNPTSRSNWSDVSEIVKENCAADEYLQTQLPLELQICAPCPAEAYCGGMHAENIVAKPGIRRVHWSESGLGFTECSVQNACTGFDVNAEGRPGIASISSSQLDSSQISNATRLLRVAQSSSGTDRPSRLWRMRLLATTQEAESQSSMQVVELPSLNSTLALGSYPSWIPIESWLNPGLIEGCAAGYEGALCSSCVDGHTKADKGACRPCETKEVVIFAAVAIGLLVMIIVLGLTCNAVWSKGRTTVEVTAMKIAFSHLQTVAVASRLPFQYPGFVLRLFAAMDSLSSVQTDVLSLDCLLTPETQSTAFPSTDDNSISSGLYNLPLGSRFIAKSIITLCIPAIIVGIAAIFWSIWPILRAACCLPLARLLACTQPASRNAKLGVARG